MGFLPFENIWRLVIDKSRLSGMNEKKLGLIEKDGLQKKRFGITLDTIFSFFGGCVPYKKDDSHQKYLKRILFCLLSRSLYF
jgi:hypothetical protein